MNIEHAMCALALWRLQIENENLRLENARLMQELKEQKKPAGPREVKKNADQSA